MRGIVGSVGATNMPAEGGTITIAPARLAATPISNRIAEIREGVLNNPAALVGIRRDDTTSDLVKRVLEGIEIRKDTTKNAVKQGNRSRWEEAITPAGKVLIFLAWVALLYALPLLQQPEAEGLVFLLGIFFFVVIPAFNSRSEESAKKWESQSHTDTSGSPKDFPGTREYNQERDRMWPHVKE